MPYDFTPRMSDDFTCEQKSSALNVLTNIFREFISTDLSSQPLLLPDEGPLLETPNSCLSPR